MKTKKGFEFINSFIGSLFIMTNSVSQQHDPMQKYCSCFINSLEFCCLCRIIDSFSSLVVRHLSELISVLMINAKTYSSKNALV